MPRAGAEQGGSVSASTTLIGRPSTRRPVELPLSRCASRASEPWPSTWTKIRDSVRADGSTRSGAVDSSRASTNRAARAISDGVHDLAGLLDHQLERQVIAEPPHDRLGDPVAGAEGGQAAERLADPRVVGVVVDVHDGERVARGRGRQAVVEADAGDGDVDRLAGGHGDGPRARPRRSPGSSAGRRPAHRPGSRRRLPRGWRPSPARCSASRAAAAAARLGDLARGDQPRRDDHVQPALRGIADRQLDLVLPLAAGDHGQIAGLAGLEQVDGLGRHRDRRRRRLGRAAAGAGAWSGRSRSTRPATSTH